MAHVYSALQLQFFMVQAINYSMIIVKIKCKTHNITNRKRLPWYELINPYNFFFIVSVFHHTSRETSRRLGESLKLPRLQKLGQRLGSCNVSSRFRLGLVSVSAQKVSCTSLGYR